MTCWVAIDVCPKDINVFDAFTITEGGYDMIRTITTQAGSSVYAHAAQKYAISISNALDARLRVVAKWDEDEVPHNIDTPVLAQKSAKEMVAQAKEVGVDLLESDCRHIEGLLDEARMSDLFVVGMPTDTDVANEDQLTSQIQDAERPLLHDAECSVLVVSKPPTQPINHVMVQYQGGIEGKSALRVAGELSLGCAAKVTVLSIHGDINKASKLAHMAKSYLEGYDLKQVDVVDTTGVPDSWVEIKNAAQSCQADVVVFGEDPYGFWERFLTQNTGERMADATDFPVLLAR